MVVQLRLWIGMMSPVRYVVFALALLFSYSASAEELTLPDAPSSHKFLDRQNIVVFSTLASLVAVDAVVTQRAISSGRAHEANPLWKPLVGHGWQGEMAASALGFSASMGMAYTFHKTGHHKMERFATWLAVASEAGVDCNNLMIARHY
jgi:hypothetical protein